MRVFFALLVTYLAVAINGLPDSHIVGGTDAAIGGHPYMVSLRRNNKHFCGGSIIDKRYVLTAAHCLMKFTKPEDLKNVTIHAGTNFLNETGDVYGAEKAIMHEKFSLLFIRNDIGLLRLKKDIVYSKTVQPITIASTDLVEPGEPCFLTGWGTLKFMGKIPNSLQKVDLQVYSQTRCKFAFWIVQSGHICAFAKYGQGACHGDSGSPLVSKGMQIGLASFVQPCAVGRPDVYTRVSVFKDWLAQHVVNTE